MNVPCNVCLGKIHYSGLQRLPMDSESPLRLLISLDKVVGAASLKPHAADEGYLVGAGPFAEVFHDFHDAWCGPCALRRLAKESLEQWRTFTTKGVRG